MQSTSSAAACPLVPSYQALLTTAAEPVRQSQRILHKCNSASTRLAAHCSTQAPVQIQKSTFCDLRVAPKGATRAATDRPVKDRKHPLYRCSGRTYLGNRLSPSSWPIDS